MVSRAKAKAHELHIWAVVALCLLVSHARQQLGKHSILFFAWYYFGIKLALHQEFWVHRLLRSRRHLLLAPRGHGKSELLSKIIPLWLICRDRNERILIVAVSADNAQKHAITIREELQTNERLIRDFGKFYDPKKSKVWQQTRIQVVRSKNLKDPTLQTIGMTSSVTGGRFTRIIFDDIIDPDAVNTTELMEKTRNEVIGTILPLLEPGGTVWAIGTRKHFGDIYGWMLDNPMWTATINRAIIREPKHEIVKLGHPRYREDGTEQWYVVNFPDGDSGECLWPEHKPMEELLLERMEMGTVLFNREMQNVIVDDETALFPMKYLKPCCDESISYFFGEIPPEVRSEFEVIAQGVDPSLVTDKKQAERTDSDYMVQVAIGLTPTRDRYLLALDRERGLTPDQVEKRIKTFYERIQPFRCAIEANSFGAIHTHNLIAGTGMKITRHDTGKNKHDPYEGVPHLSPLFENSKIHLPYRTDRDKAITDKLISELHAFGTDPHDDQVMSFWITEYLILRYLKGQARQRRTRQRREHA